MAAPNSRGSRTRVRLVEAALDVLHDEGAPSLTLAAVADRAGVGKGTLLYHFPTKEALVEGVVAHHLDRTDTAVAELAAELSGPTAWLEAFVRFHLRPQERASGRALFAALTVHPDVVESARERQQHWLDKAAEGADPAVALVLTLAVAGLWVSDTTSGSVPDDVVAQSFERVLALAGVATSGGRAGL